MAMVGMVVVPVLVLVLVLMCSLNSWSEVAVRNRLRLWKRARLCLHFRPMRSRCSSARSRPEIMHQ